MISPDQGRNAGPNTELAGAPEEICYKWATDTLDDTKKAKAQLIAEITVLRDAISDGFIVFDPDDRVIALNAKQHVYKSRFVTILRNITTKFFDL